VVYGRHREGQDIYREDFEPADVPAWVVELLQRVERHRSKRDVHFTPDSQAAGKGQALWSRIRRRLPERIVVTVEEGPEAYTAAPDRDDVVRIRRPDTSRSGADGAVVYYLISLHLSDDDIRNIYQAMPIGTLGKYAERGDSYLRTTITNQRAFYEKTNIEFDIDALNTNGRGHGPQTDVPPTDGPAPQDADDSDPLPTIDAGEQDLRVITPLGWGAIRRVNNPAPFLFRHGGVPVRIEHDDHGRPLAQELTAPRLRHELARLAEFYVLKVVRGNTTRRLTYPPKHLVEDMLATAEPSLPVLTRITECPTFGPDGSLQTTAGYHAASQVYCALPTGLVIPEVPTVPMPGDVARAKNWFAESLGEFPFVSQADYANAVGLGLEPYARDLIPGPTPLRIVEAPLPGCGKGLLVEALLRPSCGRNIGAIAQAADDDEMRKRITAMLRDGYPAIQIDNVTRPLDSASLSMGLTIPYWADRLLGQTATVRFPVRCAWVVTANNPSVSTEIARRSIRIRLDPQRDRPWEREGWRHPELLAWVDEHRGELIWAALVLIQSWVAAGRPRFSGTALGSYEQWSHVIGGVLEHVGIGGFLGNLAEFYDLADIESAVWRAFVEAWWEKYHATEVGTAELFPIAQEIDGLDLGSGSEKAQRTVFGKALGQQRDRVVGEYRITKAGEYRRAARWRLVSTRGAGVGV
jgi:hypothetical protein